MGYLVLRLFRLHPPDEEEIINRLLNKTVISLSKRVRSIQLNVSCTDCILRTAFVVRKNCNYYQVIIWLLILEIMLQKKSKKIFPEVDYQLLSHYFTFDIRNHVAENTLPKDESQLLPSHNLALHYRNHVAENTFPMVESLQLPSHHLIS